MLEWWCNIFYNSYYKFVGVIMRIHQKWFGSKEKEYASEIKRGRIKGERL